MKQKKPLIGITCEVEKLKPYFAEFTLECDYRYVRAIIRAGGIPILIPINPFKKDLNQLLDRLDGIVIIGGNDIHPCFYGERSHKKTKPNYRGRVYFEFDLIRTAQKKKMPILAICYGMQLLNVMCGGTLHQDIPSEIRDARNHRSKKTPVHYVEVKPGSLCHKIFGERKFQVHSKHHQAVKVPGKLLRITAFSEDGIPEAIEGPENTIAVQWHPERSEKDPIQARLFRYFIRLAQSKKS